ncbi:MAG TPA: glutamine synthetase type III, partial [Maribacter sp.]|nr:glutamine synthetase type III [Maribacter sp.]
MMSSRFTAIKESQNRNAIAIQENGRRSDLFGINVFNEKKMLQYLTKDAFEGLKGAMDSGSKIDRKIADQVAEAIKGWAISMGATHYTHWFQPLT